MPTVHKTHSHHNSNAKNHNDINIKINLGDAKKKRVYRRKASDAVVQNQNVIQQPMPMPMPMPMPVPYHSGIYYPQQSTHVPDDSPPPSGFDSARANQSATMSILSRSAKNLSEHETMRSMYQDVISGVHHPENDIAFPQVEAEPAQAVPVPSVQMADPSVQMADPSVQYAPSQNSVVNGNNESSNVQGSSIVRGHSLNPISESDASTNVQGSSVVRGHSLNPISESEAQNSRVSSRRGDFDAWRRGARSNDSSSLQAQSIERRIVPRAEREIEPVMAMQEFINRMYRVDEAESSGQVALPRRVHFAMGDEVNQPMQIALNRPLALPAPPNRDFLPPLASHPSASSADTVSMYPPPSKDELDVVRDMTPDDIDRNYEFLRQVARRMKIQLKRSGVPYNAYQLRMKILNRKPKERRYEQSKAQAQ